MRAGLPYTLNVALPKAGQTVYASCNMKLYKVQIIGPDGSFDRIQRWKFTWLTGPRKGTTESSYSQLFWRVPSRRERAMMVGELLEHEKAKLIAGGYPGLKPSMFGLTA